MRTALIAALAGTVLAGSAIAQTPPAPVTPAPMAPGMNRMMRADTDGDGRISRAEAIAEADTRFARMDANNDGKLCGDENMRRGRRAETAENTMPPPPPPAAGKADKDGDGCISRDEFRARAMKRFERLDANHDGFIDQAEMQAYGDRMMQMREQRQGGTTPPTPAPQNPGQ